MRTSDGVHHSFRTTEQKLSKGKTSSVKDNESLIFWYLFERGTAFTLVPHCLLILRLLDSQWGCVLVLRLEG